MEFSVQIVVILIFAKQFLSNFCHCNVCKNKDNFQVECSQIPNDMELRNIPRNIQYLIINCLSQKRSEKIMDFHIFPHLVFISISCCQMDDISESTFHNLPHLREVTLAELTISTIHSNMFKNSTNIRKLSLIQLPNLTSISKLALTDCHQMEEILLGGLNLSQNAIRPFLLMVHSSLKILSWNHNLQKLDLDNDFFKFFSFNELKLMRNKINDLEFLQNVLSQEIYLNYNEIGIYFYLEKYHLLIQNTSVLSVEHNFIFGQFPKVHDEYVTEIERLYISNNFITGFPKIFHDLFPRLVYLDASQNKIVTLGHSLQNMPFLKTVILSRNPLYCGCELNWIWKQKTLGRISCNNVLNVDKNSNMISMKTVYNNSFIVNGFPCTSPITYMKFSKFSDSVQFSKENLSIDLYPCEYIQVMCISQGDPKPELEIVNLNEPIFLNSLSIKIDAITVSSQLFNINHSDLSTISRYNSIYCTGTNPYGKTSISLQFKKMNGQRVGFRPFEGVKTSYNCEKLRNSANMSTFLTLRLLLIFIDLLLIINIPIEVII